MKNQTRTLMMILAVAVAAAERAMTQQQPIPAPEAEPQVSRRVVVNIPAMSLELFENNELVRSYRIAVGKRSTPTPIGTFRIANQAKNPTWYGPNKEVVKPGPANPVGTRWIGLDKKGYGIHGTNAPKSIGRAASHGCIRMRRQDVEELFTLVRVGDGVTIVYETVAADGTTLRDVYGLAATASSAPSTPASTAGGGL